jgi:hypothetical protein
VLHATSRVDSCAAHVTLTLRDHAMDATLPDLLLPQGAFPLQFQDMLDLYIQSSGRSSSAGATGAFNRGTTAPLMKWISSSATMVQVSVNGGAPERIHTGLETIVAMGSLQLHADRLRAEAVESIDDLSLLNRDDIVACGLPAADATRIAAALQAGFCEHAAVEESKSSGVAAPPPPGKVLVDEETYDDAAARAAELETSLTAHQEELRRLKGLLAERGIPDSLVCPLSLEIYEDPVVAADGFSYERREIELWFGRGKRTSPKTNEELPHTFLTPNRDLKSTCQDFLDDVRKFEAC